MRKIMQWLLYYNFRGFFITIVILGSENDILSHRNPLSLTVKTFYRRWAGTKL